MTTQEMAEKMADKLFEKFAGGKERVMITRETMQNIIQGVMDVFGTMPQASSPFERLEELTDINIQIERPYAFWDVVIRPQGGGFPLVKGESETLSEAVKQAVELWETK